MTKFITIIYANRNRDLKRIKASLDSLDLQANKNFEVIFVDYGSEKPLVESLGLLMESYSFVTYHTLETAGLLWNKSKALNYGIKNAGSPYIFISDVDLIFKTDTTGLLQELADHKKFFLFKLGYLDHSESKKLFKSYNFEDLKPFRFGDVNGMILASTEAFLEVDGLDEFFHFYGSEDEDLFARMENAGFKREDIKETCFYHNWHQSFVGSEDKILTGNPRVKNIIRLNQRHFLRNMEMALTKPKGQNGMGKVLSKQERALLKRPTKTFKIFNILAHVEHFLREELPSHKGEIIKVEFVEDPFFYSLKYRIRKLLGRQSQPYCSLKEVNDMVLKEMLFKYRNANYSFVISENLKTIIFCIKL